MRILVVNPNTTVAMTETIGRAARAAATPGTEIVAVNPLPETGLISFMNPQEPLGLLGRYWSVWLLNVHMIEQARISPSSVTPRTVLILLSVRMSAAMPCQLAE